MVWPMRRPSQRCDKESSSVSPSSSPQPQICLTCPWLSKIKRCLLPRPRANIKEKHVPSPRTPTVTCPFSPARPSRRIPEFERKKISSATRNVAATNGVLKPVPVVKNTDPSGNVNAAAVRHCVAGKIRLRSKVKVNSPRLGSGGGGKGRCRNFESFAVVKRSVDPQKDFRDSMVEMFCMTGSGRPEELESLLACYLSLNSDMYHDVIVKVFRQVWFELKQKQQQAPAASGIH